MSYPQSIYIGLQCFAVFMIFALVSGVWAFYDLLHFTRFEGKTKRGVRIGTLPLVPEFYQYLTTLQTDVRCGQYFLRKRNQEVLLVEHRSFSFVLLRTIFYIAYVDLDRLERRIEFRMPFSYLVIWVSSPILFLLFWFTINLSFGDIFQPSSLLFVWVFPLIFIIMWLVGIVTSHYTAVKRLLNGLDEMMEKAIV